VWLNKMATNVERVRMCVCVYKLCVCVCVPDKLARHVKCVCVCA